MDSFEQSLAFGQIGESCISKWLQSRGHSVFPAYQVEHDSGKGPQLFTAEGDRVLPDLLAFRGGGAIWFEAKHKTCFTWHRITSRWVTGIDLRHYDEYREVADMTAFPVWLLFFHPQATPSANDLAFGCPPECPTGLFGQEISKLTQTENHRSDKYGKSGMVYWAVDKLRRVATAERVAA